MDEGPYRHQPLVRRPEPKAVRQPLSSVIWRRSPSLAMLRNTCTSMARLLAAGIPVNTALRNLAETSNGALADGLVSMAQSMEAGASLADAMQQSQPRLFSPPQAEVVRAAEQLGEVGPAMDRLARDIQRQIEGRHLLLRHSGYPMLVLVISIFLGPLPTLVVHSPEAYVQEVAVDMSLLLGVVLTALVLLPWAIRNTALGDSMRRVAWRLPWIGTAYVRRVRANLLDSLSASLSGGVPLRQSLRSAAAVTSDPTSLERVESVIRALDGGTDLSTALVNSELMERKDLMIASSGEHSGTLDDALHMISDTYGEHADRSTRRLLGGLGHGLMIAVFIRVALGILSSYQSAQSVNMELMDELYEESPMGDSLLEELKRDVPGLDWETAE